MVREALTTEQLGRLQIEEAAALFITRRADGFTAGERELFEAWLAADEAHQNAFRRADRAWAVFDQSEGDEILEAMRQHAFARRRTWVRWRTAAVAASLLFAIGAVVLSVPGLRSLQDSVRQTTVLAEAAIQYSSAHGEVKEIALPDGSTMTLDADSAALGRFGAAERSIQLIRGRAFFVVAHDSARVFTVTAGTQRTSALGTRFDINVAAGTLTITLVEGSVMVTSIDGKAAAVTLQSGQRFVERLGRTTVQTIGDRTEQATSWRSGVLDFDNEPLSEAVAVVNRYSLQVPLVIHDARVAALRLSGEFRAGDPERFTQTVAELYKLRLVRHASDIELIPAG